MPDPNDPTQNLNPNPSVDEITVPTGSAGSNPQENFSFPSSDSAADLGGEPPQGSQTPLDTPPIVVSPKKGGGKKIIATILGLLVLVGGLAAGLILVRQQQQVREKAYFPGPPTPNPESICPEVGQVEYFCSNTGDTICIGPGNPIPAGCTRSGQPLPGETPGPSGTSAPAPSSSPSGGGSPAPTNKSTVTTTTGGNDTIIQCQFGANDTLHNHRVTRYNFPSAADCQARRCLVNDGPGPQPHYVNAGDPPYACVMGPDPIIPYLSSGGATCDNNGCTATIGNCQAAQIDCGIGQGGSGDIGINCSGCGVAPTPTPTGTAQCLNIAAYDINWVKITDLSKLAAGDKVRFTVAGSTTSGGTFDSARFTINGVQRPEVSQKRPGSDEFFDEYTIPAGTTSFTINAQLHDSVLGWF